jgi:predicted small metal-binding protein
MRYRMDCRYVTSVPGCTMSLAAQTREELLEAAVDHAVDLHDAQDTQRLRADLSANILETEEQTVPI